MGDRRVQNRVTLALSILTLIIIAVPASLQLYEFFFLRPDVLYEIFPVEALDWVLEEVGATVTSRFITGIEIRNIGPATAKVDVHIKDLPAQIASFRPFTDRYIIDCGGKRDPEHGGTGYDFLKCRQPELVQGCPTFIRVAFDRRVTLTESNVEVSCVTAQNIACSARFGGASLAWWQRIARLTPIVVPSIMSFWFGYGVHCMWTKRRHPPSSAAG